MSLYDFNDLDSDLKYILRLHTAHCVQVLCCVGEHFVVWSWVVGLPYVLIFIY